MVQYHKALPKFEFSFFTFLNLPYVLGVKWMSGSNKHYEETWSRLKGIKSDRVTSFCNGKPSNFQLYHYWLQLKMAGQNMKISFLESSES